MRTTKLAWWTLLVSALFVTVAAALFSVPRSVPENRVYIIGWEVDPPDQVPTNNGEPTGFAVELIREAAKRRRIRLRWVQHPESSERALRSKAVDLWPMMTITEDRKKFLHLTDPYQENQFDLFVDAKSVFTKVGDLKQQTISYDGMPFNARLLREHFHGNVHLSTSSLAEAIRSVCAGEAQAFFADHIALFSLLLRSPPCPSMSLRALLIPNIKIQLGIGATRESGAAADAIRDEISVMAGDGSLLGVMGIWNHDAGQELASLITLQQAKKRLRWYGIGLASVAVLFLLASWSAAGYRRQRIKAQAYAQALSMAERNVRLVADSLSEMVVAYDTHRHLTYINSGAEKLTGYGLAELQVAAPFSWTHPEDQPHVLALLDQVFGGRTVDQVMYRLITKDGTVKWVAGSWGPLTDEAGHNVGIRGTCQDITKRVVAEQLLEETTRKFRTIVEEIVERKRAEAALRESEERFRNMADSAPVMIWVSGLDKLYTFFNKPWLDFTGHTLEQELGDGWLRGVHSDDLERCLADYSASFDARRAFQMEYRLRRADGEYRWVLENGTPLDRGGEFAGFIGSCVDITEQKLIEERLRANEVRLIEAQRLAKVGSWELDVEADRIHWSDEVLRIFGLPNGPPSNFSAVLSHVHPKDRDKMLEADRKARSKSAPVEVEYRIVRPNGEARFVRSIVEAIRNDQGTLVRMAGATQDITEQVKARELRRESEERLKNAERLAHVGHWDWDVKAERITWSEEMLSICGQPQNSTLSREEFLQCVIPQDRERVKRWVNDCLVNRSGSSIECQIARPDSDVRTVTCTSEVLVDEEGVPERMFGACLDITDVKRAQEESFSRQKLESVGTLARGIAHDFNNLLGGVLAQAELALAELAAGSYPNEELQGIREVAIRGSEIVRQLMIYAGKENEVVGLVDVSQIVRGMAELLKVSVSKHATLETDLGKDLPAVRANAAQLRQIVMNLVTNASEALGDRDGIIRVTTGLLAAGQAAAVSKNPVEGAYVQLEVSDTGCGMSPETQARVFDPFFTTKSAGHGLGLAVVHGIVRGLGGSILLTSEMGEGTAFKVLLPCAESTPGASGNPALTTEEPSRPSQGFTVLVVEDEDPLRRAVVKTLRNAGFEVLDAASGSTAIDLLHMTACKIDVMLLDMTIPGASSSAVVGEATRVHPGVKVILTSAYSQEMLAHPLSGSQIHGFIRKPFQLADLMKMLRNTLSSPQAGSP